MSEIDMDGRLAIIESGLDSITSTIELMSKAFHKLCLEHEAIFNAFAKQRDVNEALLAAVGRSENRESFMETVELAEALREAIK